MLALWNQSLINRQFIGPMLTDAKCQQLVNQRLQCRFRPLADHKIYYLPRLVQRIGQPVFICLAADIGPEFIYFKRRLVLPNSWLWYDSSDFLNQSFSLPY